MNAMRRYIKMDKILNFCLATYHKRLLTENLYIMKFYKLYTCIMYMYKGLIFSMYTRKSIRPVLSTRSVPLNSSCTTSGSHIVKVVVSHHWETMSYFFTYLVGGGFNSKAVFNVTQWQWSCKHASFEVYRDNTVIFS